MPQKGYNRLFIIGKYRENWYHNLELEPTLWSHKFKKLGTLTTSRRRRYIGKRYLRKMDLYVTSVPLEKILNHGVAETDYLPSTCT